MNKSLGAIVTACLIWSSFSNADVNKIWEDRGPAQNLDLFWGSSSPERAPQSPYQFVKEDIEGSNPKMTVIDAAGVKWGVKFDEEVKGEVAATRLAWAVGLGVEETYYVKSGIVVFPNGRPQLERISGFIDSKGQFKEPARFEKKVSTSGATKEIWSLSDNPFNGTRELGVMILMNVVLSNWDTKDENLKVLTIENENWYIAGDYGACFGKLGGSLSHKKYNLEAYSKEKSVIESVTSTSVYLNYSGKNTEPHEMVTLEQARFFAKVAGKLTVPQIREAFRAADEPQSEAFARVVYQRIQEVVKKVL